MAEAAAVLQLGFFFNFSKFLQSDFFMQMPKDVANVKGYWTFPYYSCDKEAWLLSYVNIISSKNK